MMSEKFREELRKEKISFRVLEEEDIQRLTEEERLSLKLIGESIHRIREEQGKSTDMRYIVVRENSKFAEEIHNITVRDRINRVHKAVSKSAGKQEQELGKYIDKRV